MSPPTRVARWHDWLEGRLGRRIALQASAGMLLASLLFAALGLSGSLWLLHRQQEKDALHTLESALDQLETRLEVFARGTADLAANPLVTTALLDSRGRDVFLKPFLASFRLPLTEKHTVTLCDFEGKPLAGRQDAARDCFSTLPQFDALFATEQRQVTLLTEGAPRLLIFQPVRYPGTGHAEGYVLAALDLESVLGTLAAEVHAAGLTLSVPGRFELRSSRSEEAQPHTELPLRTGSIASEQLRLGLLTRAARPEGIEQLLAAYAVGAIAAALLTLLLALRMARRLTGPLEALTAAAEEIAAAGAPSQPVAVIGRDEVGRLAGAFNAMLASLRRSHEGLEAQVAERTCELRAALARVEHSESRYHALFDRSKVAMLLIDPATGDIVEANEAAADYYGHPVEQLRRMRVTDINVLTAEEVTDELAIARRERRSHFFFRHRLANGEVRDVEVHSGPIELDGRGLLFSVIHDITERRRLEREREQLAYHDGLTGLPNRMLLADRMKQALSRAERRRRMVAVCYMDLDGFKPVNDQYGHKAGDRLLIEIAARLERILRGQDTVARLGGDEFVLLLTEMVDTPECEAALQRVLAAVQEPIAVEPGREVTVSASIGVTLYPLDGGDADTLIRHADQAMYQAKQTGRNRIQLFDPGHDQQLQAARHLRTQLRGALVQGAFELFYQPKVDMAAGRVVGAEALVRWRREDGTIAAPGTFLPALEGDPLLVALGDYVIDEALAALTRWRAAGLDLAVSVNVAARQLVDEAFLAKLAEALARHPGVEPSRLELEILETTALDDLERVNQVIAQCAELGVKFALDDFGTGYSSMTYFRRLRMNVVKIDQSFVRDMLDDQEDMAIVSGILAMTSAFGKTAVAEGVEYAEHGVVLLRLGCPLAQGYALARPMPEAQFTAWVANFRPDPAWSQALRAQWPIEDFPLATAAIELRRKVSEPNGGGAHPQRLRLGRWLERAAENGRPVPFAGELRASEKSAAELLERLAANDPQMELRGAALALADRIETLAVAAVRDLHGEGAVH